MTTESKSGGEFSEFLRGMPTRGESEGSVSLVGAVYRTEQEGRFLLALPGGQAIELEAEAVHSFRILQEQGPQSIVELEVARNRIPQQGVPWLGRVVKHPAVDRLSTQPGFDRQDTVQWIDTFQTHPCFDQPKRPWLDGPFTGPADTWVQGIGSDFGEAIDPGGRVGDPQAAMSAAPFVMATPHHAPQAQAMMQGVGVAGIGLPVKPINVDTIFKEVASDQLIDPIKQPALDKLISDKTITVGFEGIFDPRLPGGGLINPPIWGLPGLMF